MAAPLSERFERSSLGQLVVSVGIVLVLLSQLGTHLPPSALNRAVGPTANQMVRVLASEQAWGVFAPNPRTSSLRVEGRVTFADGSTTVWTGVQTGAELFDRLHALPGFGGEKAKIFLALLAKRFDIRPAGWEQVAAPFSDDVRRSVADADSPEHLEEVRAFKKMMKAKGKGKAD